MTPVCGKEEILTLQNACRETYVQPELLDYMTELTRATRTHRLVEHGVSHRGLLALVTASQAFALVQGRRSWRSRR